MDDARTFNGAPFPLKIATLRRACARAEKCPECGGELDTGWECNDCGYDARDEAYTPEQRDRDQRMKETVTIRLRTWDTASNFSTLSQSINQVLLLPCVIHRQFMSTAGNPSSFWFYVWVPQWKRAAEEEL